MQSRKTSSSPAANRSGSRSNGSSRSSSSKLDPTGMYKKPSQQQVKCHYLDPTGLYWEKRRRRRRRRRSCRCDPFWGRTSNKCELWFSSRDAPRIRIRIPGEQQRHECTHGRWLSCGFFGWGSVAARKRPAVGGEESFPGDGGRIHRQTADARAFGGRSLDDLPHWDAREHNLNVW